MCSWNSQGISYRPLFCRRFVVEFEWVFEESVLNRGQYGGTAGRIWAQSPPGYDDQVANLASKHSAQLLRSLRESTLKRTAIHKWPLVRFQLSLMECIEAFHPILNILQPLITSIPCKRAYILGPCFVFPGLVQLAIILWNRT